MNHTTRSRLARKESRRMMQQSIILVVVTVFLVGAIIIWGIPLFIKAAGYLGELRSSRTQTLDTIAPYAPQLAVDFDATNSATININGFAETGSTVTLFHDGEKVTDAMTDDNGNFVFADIRLAEGKNELTAQATDDAGNQSQISKPVDIVMDDQPPSLSVSSPNPGQEFFGDSERIIKVSGKTDPGTSVYVNDNFTMVNANGDFSRQISLGDGENQIEIRAIDDAGNETKQMVKVNFNK